MRANNGSSLANPNIMSTTFFKGKALAICGFLASISFTTIAQPHSHRLARAVKFPKVNGLYTLSADLHQHTVFSDGSVWPDIRVQEALKDGLDIISLTEHLEYQPHKDDIPHPDRNRSYEIAIAEAKNHDLMVVKGAEITRKMPPGHCNAVFLTDANALLATDSLTPFEQANKQGAFVFWNHPNWTAQRKDGLATLTGMHRDLIKRGWLHGIEVVNETTFSDEALQIALDNNLTIMGTSDIHGLIDWMFAVPVGGHRPVTLVFANQKTPEAIKQGLMERKTVVFFNDLLIGREEWVAPLAKASITVDTAHYQGDSQVMLVKLSNQSSCPFTLVNKSKYSFHDGAGVVKLPANGSVELLVKTIQPFSSLALDFEVLNTVTAPGKHAFVRIDCRLQ